MPKYALVIDQPALVHCTVYQESEHDTLTDALAELARNMDDISHPHGRFTATITDSSGDCLAEEEYTVDL